MVEHVKLDSLITFNVDIESAPLIIFSCKFGDGCLRDVEVVACAHTMIVDWVLGFLNSTILRKISMMMGSIIFFVAMMVFTFISFEMFSIMAISAYFVLALLWVGICLHSYFVCRIDFALHPTWFLRFPCSKSARLCFVPLSVRAKTLSHCLVALTPRSFVGIVGFCFVPFVNPNLSFLLIEIYAALAYGW
jgi:hypothetical protein